MSNNLIESTIRFAENTSRINGNLRSGVIKEAQSFPDHHVVPLLHIFRKEIGDGAMGPEARGVVANHAETKLGYSRDQAEALANHVDNLDSIGNYIAAPKKSSLDQENIYGALGGGSKFPPHHVESGLNVLKHHEENGHPYPDDAVALHGMALGYSHKKATEFANAVRSRQVGDNYRKSSRSRGDRENIHGALGGSGKYADE